MVRPWAFFVLVAGCAASPARPIDNAAQPQHPQPQHPRPHKTELHVLLVGADMLYLEGALVTLPNVTVDEVSAVDYDPDRAARADVIVFNDYTPRAWPATPDLVLIHPTHSLIAVRREITNPRITSVAEAHPVMRYVDLSNVRIDRSRVFEVDASLGEAALATTNRGSIMIAKDDGRQRVVVLGFALGDTDLPLRTGFPILLRNVLAWFAN